MPYRGCPGSFVGDVLIYLFLGSYSRCTFPCWVVVWVSRLRRRRMGQVAVVGLMVGQQCLAVVSVETLPFWWDPVFR